MPHAFASRYNRTASIHLGIIAGYVDTVGFIALAGLFTAHVTGNFILIASEMVGNNHALFLRLMIFPAFILGVVLAHRMAIRIAEKPLMKIFLLESFCLFACALVALAAPAGDAAESLPGTVAGMLAAAAMGIQTAQNRLARTSPSITTVMTGNVTQAVIDLLDMLSSASKKEKIIASGHFFITMRIIGGFAFGAIIGAFAFHYFSFICLLIPAIQLIFVAYLARNVEFLHGPHKD